MDIAIEFNPAAFKHGVSEEDIRWAFDTARYDGWFKGAEGQDRDKYLLIGFDRNGNPIEILYNIINTERGIIMARMTDEEADYWDEYYTKNPPIPGPNGTGFFTQRRKTAHSLTIDNLSADWLLTKAIAAHKTPAEIISDMIQREIAATL